MWFVVGEKWHGDNVWSEELPTLAEAELMCESLHRRHSGGGVWSVFKVVNGAASVYSEMECD